MKRLINKGELILIWEEGKQTQMSCNMDIDRELENGDVFIWNPWQDNRPSPRFKVLDNQFPMAVEEIED